MSSKKRSSETVSTAITKRKRFKVSGTTDGQTQTVSLLRPEEVDFPRGGGTNLTPAEYKAVRADALKELDNEDVVKDTVLQNEQNENEKGTKAERRARRKSIARQKPESSSTRVEHLNYKRLVPGMKVLCQIVAVYPFTLILSLPDQLLGHVPITHISSQLTSVVEAAETSSLPDEGSDIGAEDPSTVNGTPDLAELFRPGQYVRAVVTSVKPSGTTEGRLFSHCQDEIEKASRRVELSLAPDQVNARVSKEDLKRGFVLCAAVKSIEDHGYVLDIGLPGISGFLRYGSEPQRGRRPVGSLADVVVVGLREDRRTCIFIDDEQEFNTSILKEVSSISSLLPGTLVQALVTATGPSGLVAQVLGSVVGTIDLYHLPAGLSPMDFKVGKKVNARVLFDVSGTNPPQFALSLSQHIISLDVKKRKKDEVAMQDAYPVGTILQQVRVKRVEPERGLVVAVEEGNEGFVHISHTSDDYVESLSPSSGHWKVDTVHRARVIGFYMIDGLLQLSFRSSVLSQKFLRVEDVNAGDLVRGTVKKLTDASLFVSINGSVDAMVWPNHYADITLKHPQKRFRQGATLKCRALAVDADRRRILLTAKKSLVDSDLPILTKIEDAEAGLVSLGVVWKVGEKSLIVEFYNHLRAVIPWHEVSETPLTTLRESYPVGKPLKVVILSVDRKAARIVASIRQASGDMQPSIGDIKSVEIGQTVSGIVQEVRGDNVILTLGPSRARALISLHNVANSRRQPVECLRSSLTSGVKMDNLVVVSRNLDKGIIIVANRPSRRPQTSNQSILNLAALSVGSIVIGRVVKHEKGAAILKFRGRLTGYLHLVDMYDDFADSGLLPPIDSLVSAAVIKINRDRKRLTLSTRPSRLDPSLESNVVDPEVSHVEDLSVGRQVRGFIKSIADHGIFVTVGRSLDARVQIKELYDEYVKEWKGGFRLNEMISGRIIGIDKDKKQLEMSLRSSPTVCNAPQMTWKDLFVGQKVDGKVKKVEDYGIFIAIEGSKLSGLCHKTEITDRKDADISIALHNFREGDTVKALILEIDKEARRISLGLKPSYFSKTDSDTDSDSASNKETQSVSGELDVKERADASSETGSGTVVTVEPASIDHQPEMLPESPRQSVISLAPVLPSQGFHWAEDNGHVTETDDSSSEDESDEPCNKRRKKKKIIEQDLTEDTRKRTPESVADFERHLLASPDSSFLWIQYMSFRLRLAEIDKAQEIGRRALQAINVREEQEKLNVWIALLNLENTYGTEDSVESLFREAARYNDSKTVHLRLANIFDQSGKTEKAEEQYKRTSKKFGKSSKVWTLFGEHYLRRGLLEEARKLLPRSLQSLEKRKHLKTISKFAQLEYKFADSERGKTIFEGIIESHPKRWDLWSIYTDMEAGQKDIQSIRNLFDRVLSYKMTIRKAKSFFKKWLEFERRIGDEEGQQIVKERAIEWTRQHPNPR